MEIWKEIEGYNGLYLISSHGRVMSLFANKQKIIKQGKTKKGYMIVGITHKAKFKNYKVHRLVAKAFIPNPQNKPEVNHKDLNKANNNVDNIEWVTGHENFLHAVANGVCLPKKLKYKKTKDIIVVDLTNTIVRHYKSIKHFSDATKISINSAYKAINTSKEISYGYRIMHATCPAKTKPKQPSLF